MQRNRSILWAVLLIGIGVVLLLRNAGTIPEDVRVWPLVLIAIGVWLFLERLLFGGWWQGSFAGALVLIAIGGVSFLQDVDAISEDVSVWPVVLIAVGLAVVLSAMPSRGRRAGPVRETVALDGATSARVVIRHGAGELTVASQVNPALLVEGTFGARVRKRVRRDGDRLEVSLEHEGGWAAPWGRGGGPLDWTVGLSRIVPLELEVRGGANRTDLRLSDLEVRDLRVHTGASETRIAMPARGRVSARVEAGAASVAVAIPPRVAARISVRGGLTGVKVDESRFPRSAEGYRSIDFDDAPDRIDLEVQAGAAGIEVR
ncbi:MAG: LiaI-LiaF-like domain-containing protein [Candidatus Velamenicoccus archaeovorus]